MRVKLVMDDGKINNGGQVARGKARADLEAKTGLDLSNVHAIGWDTDAQTGEVEFKDSTPNRQTTQGEADAIQAAFASVMDEAAASARDDAEAKIRGAELLDFERVPGQGANITLG